MSLTQLRMIFQFLYRSVFFLITVVVAIPAMAQEQSLFFANPYLFNPSYAGVEGKPALFLSYRRQWINVDGSPTVANASFHAPLKQFISAGVNVRTDSRGLFKTTSGLVSGAYTLWLGDFKTLRFGMSAGAGSSRLDLSAVQDTQDPTLLNPGKTFLQGNAGVSYHSKFFHMGIALPALFENSVNSEVPSTFSPTQRVVVHASNRFYWGRHDRHLVEPYILYRLNKYMPSQLELAVVYHANDAVWMGGAYKQHLGSSAFFGFHLKETIGFGYAYTFKVASSSELNSPSHEVQLTILLGERKKNVPFYSFVDTHKGKRIQHHAHAATHRPAPKTTKTTVAKTDPPAETKPAETTVVKQEPVVQAEPAEPVAKTEVIPANPEPEKVDDDPILIDIDPAVDVVPSTPDTVAVAVEKAPEPSTPAAETHPGERHEFVKRGDHDEEMHLGDYVIVGAFKSRSNAEHFAGGLQKLQYPAEFGHLSERGLWYVYLSKSEDLATARAARDKYRKVTMFKDAWLLTVHH